MPPDKVPQGVTLGLTLSDSQGHAVSVKLPGDLVPRVGTSGRVPRLKAGKPDELTLALEIHGPPCRLPGLELSLYPGPYLLATDGSLKDVVAVTPKGWTAVVERDTFNGSVCVLRLAHADALVLDGKARRVEFKLGPLVADTNAQWPTASLTVVPGRFPGLTPGLGVDLPISKTGLTGHPLTMNWIGPLGGNIHVSPDALNPVLNTLQLEISHASSTGNDDDVDDKSPRRTPTLHFQFFYAAQAPGLGALCTAAQVERNGPVLKLDVQAQSAQLCISREGPADAPYWSLPLQDNDTGEAVLGGDKKSFVVVLEHIISDLPLAVEGATDITELVMRWQDIPGLIDGEQALSLCKVGTPRIYGLHCEPPLGTALDEGDPVTVTWHTQGAVRSLLVGGSEALEHINDGESGPQLVHPRMGSNVYQVLAFDQPLTKTKVPKTVSQAIVFAFKPPRIESFGGALSVQADGLGLDLSWETKNTQHCYLFAPSDRLRGRSAMLASSVTKHRIVPALGRPLDGAYTLLAIADGASDRKTRETTPWPKFGDELAGGILFHLDESGAHGLVVAGQLLGHGTWDVARAKCAQYNRMGYRDWRLPTSEEFSFIYRNLYIPKLPCLSPLQAEFGPLSTGLTYWSATAGSDPATHLMRYMPDDFAEQLSDGNTFAICAVRRF